MFDQNQSPNTHGAPYNYFKTPEINQNYYYMKIAEFEDPSYLVEKVDNNLFSSTEPPIGGIYDVLLPENKLFYSQQDMVPYSDFHLLTTDLEILNHIVIDFEMHSYFPNADVSF